MKSPGAGEGDKGSYATGEVWSEELVWLRKAEEGSSQWLLGTASRGSRKEC